MTTITETIPSLGSVPTTADPATFDSRADTLLGTSLPATITAINTWAGQANTVAGEVNDNANTASASAIAAASVINAEMWVSGDTYAFGSPVWSPINLLTYRRKVAGAGATDPSLDATNWEPVTIQPPAYVGDHHVTVTTGNGNGSSSTKIRRFTTTQSSAGTDIVYADSATGGGSFTIAAGGEGFYSISYQDASGEGFAMGVSVNSSQLSTDVSAITAADRLLFLKSNNQGISGSVSGVFYFEGGDVIRAHGGITSLANPPNENSAYLTKFEIRKVGV